MNGERATSQYVSVAEGWRCSECRRSTTSRLMHSLLAHTWPFRRWT